MPRPPAPGKGVSSQGHRPSAARQTGLDAGPPDTATKARPGGRRGGALPGQRPWGQGLARRGEDGRARSCCCQSRLMEKPMDG